MTDREMTAKLAELDQLLNDPETRMDAQRVWKLVAELAAAEATPAPAALPASQPAAAR
jgi:hypothetical protein